MAGEAVTAAVGIARQQADGQGRVLEQVDHGRGSLCGCGVWFIPLPKSGNGLYP